MDLKDLLSWTEIKIEECQQNINEYEKIDYYAHAIREKEKSITPEQINKFIEYLDYKSNEWKDDWYMNDSWKARTGAFKEALEVFNGLLEGKEIGELKTDWWKVP